MALSATAWLLEPTELQMATPWRVAPAMSKASTPTPCLAMTFRRGDAAITRSLMGRSPVISASTSRSSSIRASSSSSANGRSRTSKP